MVVGVTGGIGSGKTYVCSLFAEKGIPVYNTDIEAKKLMNTNASVKEAIGELLGSKSYTNGVLNRPYIAEKIFNNAALLKKMNAIVHPAVALDFEKWYEKQNADFVIKESAILFETGGYKKCDASILVTAPVSIRINRVIKRDNVSEEEVLMRIKNQWDDEEKIKLASYIIENIEKRNTILQVETICETLTKRK